MYNMPGKYNRKNYKRKNNYKKKPIRYKRKKLVNKETAITKLDYKVRRLQYHMRNGFTKPFKIEYQGPRRTLDARWNRNIVVAPNQIHSVAETRTWKTLFNMDMSPSSIYQTPKAHFTGMKLIQEFRIADLQAAGIQSLDRPVTIHNYVVRLKQDAGAEWKQATTGEWTASHLTQDIHYAMLGGNSAGNIVDSTAMFFLNKKCFHILAQHHHVFGPYGLTQATGSGTGIPIGEMTRLSRYQKTFVDWIPLNITLKSAGNTTIFGNERGWTGITYQNVPATDQVLILTWCSQGATAQDIGSYNMTHAASGLIYGRC